MANQFAERSQSAFAGYGLEVDILKLGLNGIKSRNPLSLDMGWKRHLSGKSSKFSGRNPLSLDMGWKP